MEHLASTRVAIIGAGFSGLMTAYHLLHRSPRSSVTIFERAPQQLAVGNAYAPSSPHHILNVPAAAMGARAENPKEFLTWLSAHGRDVAPTAFVSRAWYGEYLRDLFASLAATFPSRLRTVQEEVISLRRLSHGALAMQSELGAETVVDHVVLATGTTPRVVPTLGGS